MRKTLIFVSILAAACLLITACGSADQSTTSEEPSAITGIQVEEPTEEPMEEPREEPTIKPTEEPTEAPIEEPTESPDEKPIKAVNGPFRDDFEEGLHESWTWLNEEPSRWLIIHEPTGSWLQITADNPPIAPETTEIPIVNLLTRPIPQGVDIMVTTHIIDTNPDENFEQASLFLIGDGDSFVLVNLGFCSFCTNKSIYLETASDGEPLVEGIQSFPVPESTTEVWLRLEYSPEKSVCVALVALEEGEWQTVGQIVRNAPAFNLVAIGASNVPGPDANPDDDLIATFDYVEIKVFE